VEAIPEGALYPPHIRRQSRRMWQTVRSRWPGSPAVLRKTACMHFPLTFFLRNVAAVRKEFQAGKVPARVQRRTLMRLLRQRISCYSQVKSWLKGAGIRPDRIFGHPEVGHSSSPYCNHCGGCCEIPGGMPDFPGESPLPAKGREWFGEGLGPGHRFCPFLWESGETGRSFCSIHPWRPNPCRIFDHEECAVVKGDPDFTASCRPEQLLETCRWLVRLLDGR